MSNTRNIPPSRLEKNLEYRKKVAIQKKEQIAKLAELYKKLMTSSTNEKVDDVPAVT